MDVPYIVQSSISWSTVWSFATFSNSNKSAVNFLLEPLWTCISGVYISRCRISHSNAQSFKMLGTAKLSFQKFYEYILTISMSMLTCPTSLLLVWLLHIFYHAVYIIKKDQYDSWHGGRWDTHSLLDRPGHYKMTSGIKFIFPHTFFYINMLMDEFEQIVRKQFVLCNVIFTQAIFLFIC